MHLSKYSRFELNDDFILMGKTIKSKLNLATPTPLDPTSRIQSSPASWQMHSSLAAPLRITSKFRKFYCPLRYFQPSNADRSLIPHSKLGSLWQ